MCTDMCMDKCIDMCTDTCMDKCTDIRTDMHLDQVHRNVYGLALDMRRARLKGSLKDGLNKKKSTWHIYTSASDMPSAMADGVPAESAAAAALRTRGRHAAARTGRRACPI